MKKSKIKFGDYKRFGTKNLMRYNGACGHKSFWLLD
jgi:hypothetical protein